MSLFHEYLRNLSLFTGVKNEIQTSFPQSHMSFLWIATQECLLGLTLFLRTESDVFVSLALLSDRDSLSCSHQAGLKLTN